MAQLQLGTSQADTAKLLILDTAETRLSWKKKAAFAALIVFGIAAIPELCLRVYFAVQVGPSVLMYGLREHGQLVVLAPSDRRDAHERNPEKHTVSRHSNRYAGYSKYFPHQIRIDHDQETQQRFRAHINSHGFRGEEFEQAKTPGVARVITLGASSTFGYYNRDDETYPAFLEEQLNKRCIGGPSFEVINLGIPHLGSNQIRSLFLAEALPLDPDVVTYYEGMADSNGRWTVRGEPLRTRGFLRDYLLTVETIEEWLESFGSRYSEAEMRALRAGHVAAAHGYIRNIARIRQACLSRGVLFVVASQQAKSRLVPQSEIKGVRYRDERSLVIDKFSETGRLTKHELFFLRHAVLMGHLPASGRNAGKCPSWTSCTASMTAEIS